jgi:serine/threonine-protein kinase RsbT
MDRATPEVLVRVSIRDESDVVVARRRTRELASQQRLSEAAAEALATAVTEIARNIVVHAGSGEILFGLIVDAPRRGVIVTARDTGPGIPRIEQAMQDGFSTRGGLGFGLPGARRLVDEFEIESKVGEGTTVTLRKWASAESR